MRAYLLAATALTGAAFFLVPGAALAQSSYDWSGFYTGITVGQMFDTGEFDFSYDPGPEAEFESDPDSLTLSEQALAIGLNVGHNWQSGSLVYGVELDAFATSLNAAGQVGNEDDGEVSAETSLHALLTARARVGVAVDRMLFYGTGGLAVGRVSAFTDYDGDLGKGTTDTTQTAIGFTAGAGVEHAINDNATIRLEGLYYQLGDVSATNDELIFGDEGSSYTANYSARGAIIRAGLNLKF